MLRIPDDMPAIYFFSGTQNNEFPYVRKTVHYMKAEPLIRENDSKRPQTTPNSKDYKDA